MEEINRNDLRNNKWFLAGTLGLAFLVMGAISAYAYVKPGSSFGPHYSAERHSAMEKAFDDNDYESWKKLMEDSGIGNSRVMQVVNSGNFSQFSQMHELMLQGKYDEANQIREKLGLRNISERRMGMMRGNGRGGCNFQDQNQNGICDSME